MDNSNTVTSRTAEANTSVSRETTVKSVKKDIIQQIADMYVERVQAKAKLKKKDVNQILVPTKATLFGLDVRFRQIDRKLAEEKGKLVQY